jgi:hypothetical protein
MIDHQIENDLHAALMYFRDQLIHFVHGAIVGMYGIMIGDIVFVVGRGWVDRHDPDGGSTQVGDIVEFGDQSRYIPDAVAIAVAKGLDEDLVND